MICVFFFKQKTAYEMRISDWSSDVCSSDLVHSSLQKERWSSPVHRSARHWPISTRSRIASYCRRYPRYFRRTGSGHKSLPPIAEPPPPRRVPFAPQPERPLPLCRHRRSEEHTSELQSLMRISYAVFCLKKKK